jgi:RNA polymerase sigma factor (sigma-70 family)
MEVSALKYSGAMGLHGRLPLLRLQSDERLVALIRRGSNTAFEVLVSRYETRLLAFCRHLLGSREDAEDVLQEALAAAYNALLADDRPINVRPWLYRIARNRSLNHLRRAQAVGVDSMDIHLSDHGASTADKVHEREEFRLLVGDIHSLPETQKTALVLREMDALSYEQIAEAMETTVSGVKSLLVRARVSLAEASEARLLSCEEVRIELGEVAEGLRRRPSPLVRRHLRACQRCESFRGQLKETNKALTALLPVGPLVLLKKFALSHLGHSAGAGSGATAAGSGATALGSAAFGGATITSTSGFISAGIGAIASKAAAGLAVTALVTAGAVEVSHGTKPVVHAASVVASLHGSLPSVAPAAERQRSFATQPASVAEHTRAHRSTRGATHHPVKKPAVSSPTKSTRKPMIKLAVKPSAKLLKHKHKAKAKPQPLPGRTQSQTAATVLSSPSTTAAAVTTTSSTATATATATVPATTPTTTATPAAATPAPTPAPTPTTDAPQPTSSTTTAAAGTTGGQSTPADPTATTTDPTSTATDPAATDPTGTDPTSSATNPPGAATGQTDTGSDPAGTGADPSGDQTDPAGASSGQADTASDPGSPAPAAATSSADAATTSTGGATTTPTPVATTAGDQGIARATTGSDHARITSAASTARARAHAAEPVALAAGFTSRRLHRHRRER